MGQFTLQEVTIIKTQYQFGGQFYILQQVDSGKHRANTKRKTVDYRQADSAPLITAKCV